MNVVYGKQLQLIFTEYSIFNTSYLEHLFKYQFFGSMPFQQTILYSLQAPQFVHNFKNSCLQIILPKLIWLRQYLEQPSNEDQLDPILLIVIAFIVFQVFHTVYNGLFEKRKNQIDPNNTSFSAQISRQMVGLKKQLKNMQQSLFELLKQTKNHRNSTVSLNKKPQNSKGNSNLIKSCKKLLPAYQSAIQNNKNLAMYIIESQQQIFKQLKKLKKSRISFSSSRPSIGSTVRQNSNQKNQRKQKKSPRKQRQLVTKSLYSESNVKKSQVVAPKLQEQYLIKQIKSQIKTSKEQLRVANNGIKQTEKVQTNIHKTTYQQQKFSSIENQEKKETFRTKAAFTETKISQNFNSPQQKQNKVERSIEESSNITNEQTQQKQTINPPPPPAMKKMIPPTGGLKSTQKRRVPPPPSFKK